MNPKAFIDWFIPEETFVDIIELSKSRIFVSVNFITPLIISGNSFRAFIAGKMLFGYIAIAVSIILLAGPFIFRASRSLFVSGYYFMILCFCFMLFGVMDTGGVSSYFTVNFIVLVLLSYLMLGLRSGIFWGACSMVSLVVLQLMEQGGYPFPEVPKEDAFSNAISIVAVVVLLGGIFSRNSAKNLLSFVEEKNLSEKAAEDLKKVLDETNVVMKAVSQGDFSKKIDLNTKGDLNLLKASVNNSLSMLGQTIKEVLQVSEKINLGTKELSDVVQSLAEGNVKQAASIEEISSSMSEIGAKAKTNNENASQAQTLSGQTAGDVKDGNQQMQAMLKSMNQINETSSNVSKVIKVIDEIAFQTNLLALNAAVEAARAGKYGKGFAVVAEEVRNLASRSAEAARDTTELIESSIKEVENGVKNADQTAEILIGFVNSIDKVNDYVGEISMASMEQSEGVNEINNGLSLVNDVVQKISSISEESASASQELSSQAKVLRNIMSQFKLKADGKQKTKTEIDPKNIKKRKSPEALARRALQMKQMIHAKPKALPDIKKEVETRSLSQQISRPAEIPTQASSQRKIVLDDDDFGKY